MVDIVTGNSLKSAWVLSGCFGSYFISLSHLHHLLRHEAWCPKSLALQKDSLEDAMQNFQLHR